MIKITKHLNLKINKFQVQMEQNQFVYSKPQSYSSRGGRSNYYNDNQQDTDTRFRKNMIDWLSAPKYGSFIENTHLIPFKCPLAHKYDCHFSKEEIFNWEDIFAYTELEGKPLKYVIDLTFTDKYYKTHDMPKNIVHCKYMIPGKRFPKEWQINEIFQIFEKARIENATVGIHCTHGKNRTGLIAIWYMIKYLKFAPADAIECFGKARGTNIDHIEYISFLLSIKADSPSLQSEEQKEDSKSVDTNDNDNNKIN